MAQTSDVVQFEEDGSLLTQAAWEGIERLLTEYAGLEKEDDIIIAYTPDSREAAACVGVVCEEHEFQPRYVPMMPLRDPGFSQRLEGVAPKQRVCAGKTVLLTFERETMSHHGAIREHFADYAPEQYRVVRAINAGLDLFETGLATSPSELSALNTSLLQRLQKAERLRIKTDAGTDLQVRLDNDKFRFISNRGVAQPRQFVIIPAGEVATFPAEISGVLVADFALNVNMIFEGDVRLLTCPVTVNIKDGVLTDYECANPEMKKFLDYAFGRSNARRVGELGFGTNKAVRDAVRENSHLNERVPGVHLGFGQHNQTNESAGYACDIHIDLCAKGGHIWIDDDPAPLDLEALEPSSDPHPAMARDEDIFSEELQGDDCCGLVREKGEA